MTTLQQHRSEVERNVNSALWAVLLVIAVSVLAYSGYAAYYIKSNPEPASMPNVYYAPAD